MKLEEAGRLFARQDALATIAQLEELGVTDGLRRQRLDAGEWVKLSRNVVGLAGAPDTWRRRVRVAWLTAGDESAVSHSTAARVHGFDGFDRAQQIHLTVCGLTHLTAPPGVHLHRSTLLDMSSCVTVDGIRVVGKPVALIQIAGTRPRDFAGRALDGLLRDGVPAERLAEVAHQWHRRGVKGPPVVLQLINQRVQQRLPRSWFQRLAKRVLHGRGLRMVDEYPIDDPVTGRRIADLDLAIPSLKIGVECQSWEWHSTPTAQARDAARKRRLRVQLGWEIVELWWTDLTRIDGVVEEVQYLIDQRTRPTFGVLTS